MHDLSNDEAAILAVIHANRIALWTQDFESYQKCFVQASYTSRWNASPVTGIFVRQGWEEISEKVRTLFADPSGRRPSNAYETEVLDLDIRVSGDLAWATFRQKYPAVGGGTRMSTAPAWHDAGGLPTHEVRIFERHDRQWRIAFLGFLDLDTGPSNSACLGLAPDGTIEWQNEAATTILSSDDDLVVRNGYLRVRDAKTDARLQAAIRWAAKLTAPLVPQRGSLPIIMQAGEGLPAKVWWIIAANGQIFFSLGDTDNEKRIEAAAIVYGLSPAQRQVTGHIIGGKTLGETAQAMGITTNTARTHLDRVFEKAGVRTQSALVRVILSAGAPI